MTNDTHRKLYRDEGMWRLVEAVALLVDGEPRRAGFRACSAVLYLDVAWECLPGVVRGLVVEVGRKLVGGLEDVDTCD